MSQRIPDWVLERYAAGELPEGYRAADLEKDPSVQERLTALRQHNEDFLKRLPPAQVAREIRRRAERQAEAAAKPTWSIPRWTVALAAVCVAAVVIPSVLRQSGGDDEIRTKGLLPHLEVYRQAGNATEVLSPNAPAQAGDVLQLRIVGAGARFAAVVSVDGTGSVTPHAPQREGAALALPSSGVQVLPNAYALDAAPRFERFILVTSDQPFDVAVVLSAARALGPDPTRPLALPEGLRQSSFLVKKKEERR